MTDDVEVPAADTSTAQNHHPTSRSTGVGRASLGPTKDEEQHAGGDPNPPHHDGHGNLSQAAANDNFPKCCDKCDSWSGYQFCDDVGPRCRHGCANCQVVQMRPVKTFRCGDGRPVFDGQGTPPPCPPPCKKH
ncbi:uncharacterized protein [Triticum aestivum]|uniref:uncharacterized protein n=1 Tax=Triticum aestivum TaxID=4565 RepID=UPI001D01E32F|nr:uncharacterized protein LOC123101706 [Triticum aestivum]